MTEKARDANGIWRNVFIGFRVTDEEMKEIEKLARELNMQIREYIHFKLGCYDIHTYPNSKMARTLKPIFIDVENKYVILLKRYDDSLVSEYNFKLGGLKDDNK